MVARCIRLGLVLAVLSIALTQTAPVGAANCDYCRYFSFPPNEFIAEDWSFWMCWPHDDHTGPRYCFTDSEGQVCAQGGLCYYLVA